MLSALCSSKILVNSSLPASIASRKEATEKWSLEQNSASENVTLNDYLKTLLKSKQQEIMDTLKSFKIRELEFQVFKQVRDIFFADRDSVEAEVDALGKEFKVDDCEFSAEEDVRSDDGSDEGSDLEGFIISDEENEVIEDVEFNPENENEGYESVNEDEYQLPSPSPSPLKKKSSSQKFKRSTIIIDDSEDDNHDDVKVISDEERESQSSQKKSITPVSPPKRSEALTSISAEVESEEIDENSEFRAALRSAPGEWFVVHSYAGYEKKVKANLANRIQSLNMEDYVFQIEEIGRAHV
jgi:hypothetical protein